MKIKFIILCLLPPALWAQSPAPPMPVARYGQLPLAFEANVGQSDPAVKFLSHGRGYGLFLTSSEAVLETGEQSAHNVLRMKLLNANLKAIAAGGQELDGKVNYFLGNDPKQWRTNVPTFGRVRYHDVYPGVDLVYHGDRSGQLEYDFVVAPGAGADAIRFAFEGSRNVTVDSAGDLIISLKNGQEARVHKPVVYQEAASGRVLRQGSFVTDSRHRVRFALGPYDRTRPLIVDPVLTYATYVGGSQFDWADAIAVDSSGNTYITGQITSSNFPVTTGAYQSKLQTTGATNAFVAKLNATGTALIYATYLGGNTEDIGKGIAVDSAGSAYIVGLTSSTNFPITSGALQGANNAFYGFTSFEAELDPTGSTLVFSTYFGGNIEDAGVAIALDSSRNIYVCGTTDADFPVSNALQGTAPNIQVTGWVAEMNWNGSRLTVLFSTYLGGNMLDEPDSIAVDRSGGIYIAGATSSSNFPISSNAFQKTLAGSTNAFVTKLNWNGAHLSLGYSTFLGGSDGDVAIGIAVDSSGNAYVTGYAQSPNFPTTSGAYQTAIAGNYDTFIAKLNPTGSALVYSTLIGGGSADYAYGIALDASNNAYITGTTASADFPQVNPLAINPTGPNGVFVTELNATGTALVYSTLLGAFNSVATGYAIATDPLGNVYVTGKIGAANFPTTAGAFQKSLGGLNNAFVAEISVPAPQYGISLAPLSLTYPVTGIGVPSTVQSVTLTGSGTSALTISGIATTGDFALTTTGTSCPYAGGALASRGSCTIDIVFTPTQSGPRTGSVTVADNAAGSPQSIALSGTGSQPPQVTVPNVVGETQSAAGTAIAGAGLTVGTVTMQASSSVASGEVIAQTPAGGAMASQGSAVNLVISSGPPPPLSLPGTDEGIVVADAPIVSAMPALAPNTAPVAYFSAGSLGFQGQTQTLTVTLSNTGQASLTVTAASTTAAEFMVTQIACSTGGNILPVTLPPTEFCVFSVAYMAPSSGNVSGNVTFTDNTGLSNIPSTTTGPGYIQSLPVNGAGSGTAPGSADTNAAVPQLSEIVTVSDSPVVAAMPALAANTVPVAYFSPGSLGFQGQSQTLPATISNIGQANLSLLSATVSGAPFSIAQVECTNGATSLPATLAPTGACVLWVSYTAPGSGAPSGSLTITDSALLGNLTSVASAANFTQTVGLSGAGASTAPQSPNTTASISVGESVHVIETDTVLIPPTPISLATVPAGLAVSIDGGTPQTAPFTANLAYGPHTIAVAATQADTPGTQYVFTDWSDSGAASHTVQVGTASAAYTANFKIQYQLTTLVVPAIGGSVIPSGSAFYDSGTNVVVTAIPSGTFQLVAWSGGISGNVGGSSNPIQVTMDAAMSIFAAFIHPGQGCSVTGDMTASAADVHLMINEVLGAAPSANHLLGNSAVGIADVQTTVNAAIGLGCTALY